MMSREKGALPRGRLDSTEGEAEDPGLRIIPARHTYNLRNKSRKGWAATEPKAKVPSTTMPRAGGEIDYRCVGGCGGDPSAPPSEAGEGSEVSGAECSDDLFGGSDTDGDASSDWAESRSHITTPGASTSSSPRRRSDMEEEVSRRQTVAKGVTASPGPPHLRDNREARCGAQTPSRSVDRCR